MGANRAVPWLGVVACHQAAIRVRSSGRDRRGAAPDRAGTTNNPARMGRSALAWIWWYELGYPATGRQKRAPGSASGYTGLPRGASPPAFLMKLPISDH